jgi:hypothetical protein
LPERCAGRCDRHQRTGRAAIDEPAGEWQLQRMFLDERQFNDGPPPLPTPSPAPAGEVVARRFFLFLSLALLLLPVSADGIVDLVRYLID